MSDKRDDWKDFFEEDFPQDEDTDRKADETWGNPFEVEPESGIDEAWKEAFGEFAGEGEELSDELALDSLVAEEAADTFPLDEAFFGAEAEYPQAAPEMEERFAAEGSGEDLGPDIEPGDEGDVASSPEEDEYADVRTRSIRRVRRSRTGLLGGMMYAAFVVGVATIVAFVGWMLADDVLGLTKDDTPVEIFIPYNFTIDEVAEELYANGIINYRWLFTLYATHFGGEERIQPGMYQVRPVDYRAIIRSLNQRTGELIEVRVMVPEGRTMVQTFEILEANNVATVEALLYAAETIAFDEFDFLADVPMDTDFRLQGYLFPDTYIFFMHQNPESVIRTFLRNFNVRMDQNDVYELLEESEFTLHEILNIAAMIEREMASGEEAPRIASVIYNRLEIPMRLQIDATIQFILPEVEEFLTEAHTLIPSPWNTYYVDGLPYGPVANPGMAAILGALNPESTNFLFYALHIDGHHEFFRNFEQHTAFINTPNFAHHSDNR